jgi:CelD/BcsL family acetyltransferase involved in cellulose biosynthesis
MPHRPSASASPLRDPPAVANPSAATRLRIVAQARGLDRLSQRWNDLAAESAPMQQFIWSRVAAEVFGGDGRLRTFALERDRRVCAVAPLVVRGGALPRVEILGARELAEPCDLVYEDRGTLRHLVGALVDSGLPLYVPRVFSDSPLLAEVDAACGARALTVVRPAPGCPRIVLDESWREPERKLSPGRRTDLRRVERIAEALGPVAFEALSPSREELAPPLDEAFRVEDAGWKGKAGSALARDRALGVFFRRYAAAACERGILRLFFMRIASRAVATVLAAECAGRLWTLKIGYDEEFRRCSPGSLLTRYTIAYAAGRGLRSYEFLGTAAWWTAQWTRDVRPCVSLRIYPAHPKALAALALDALHWGWSRTLGSGARRRKSP